MTKKIVTIYDGDDWNKEIPISHIPTRLSFQDWHEKGLKQNIEMFRASIQWYDMKKNLFTKSWAYRDGKWLKINKAVKPDLIFDKIAGKKDYILFDQKIEISKKIKIFNNPLFRTIFDNKLNQYMVLEDFMPKSFFANGIKELKINSKKIRSKKIVIKPLYGSGGKGIVIVDKIKINYKNLEFPVLIQEFIQPVGIPGFSKKIEVSDLRMIYYNNKYIYSLSRVARGNSLFTNFHKGATAILVPENKIPKNAIVAAKKIVKKISIFNQNNYSLDFIFDKSGKPYLIEMNTTPGFDLLRIVGNKDLLNKNFDEFISVL